MLRVHQEAASIICSVSDDNINVTINNSKNPLATRNCTLISDSICKFVHLKGTYVQAIRKLDTESLLSRVKDEQMHVRFNIVLIHIGTNDILAFNDAKFGLLLNKVISEIRAKKSSCDRVEYSAHAQIWK